MRKSFSDESIGSVRTDGRQITVLATRNAEAIIERRHRLGAASVETTPVSLRELFLATVKEGQGDALVYLVISQQAARKSDANS
jgi:hypothetical protein